MSAALLFTAMPARACLFSLGLSEEGAERIAETGYLVRARVIRGYNAEKRQPETLQIAKVFVGEKLPKTIELWRDDQFYESRRQYSMCDLTVAFSRPSPGTFLIVLFPVPAAPGQPVRFRTEDKFFGITYGTRRALLRSAVAPLVIAARRTGRLRSYPRLQGKVTIPD